MSLLDTIKADQVAARKARDTIKASLLTTLLGEATQVGKNAGNRDSTDDEVVAVIKKFLKSNAENNLIAGDRRDGDWCDTLEIEREILESYLPVQLNHIEIHEVLVAAFREVVLTVKSKGALMKHLKDNYAGRYDGKVAAEVVNLMIGSVETPKTPKENTMSVQTIVAEVKSEFKALEAAVEAGLEKLNPFASKVEAEAQAEVATVETEAAPEVAKVEGQVQAAVAPVVAEVQSQVAAVVAGTEAKVVAAAGEAASAAVEKAVSDALPKA